MTEYNEEMLAHFKNKYLGYMTNDQQEAVEVTDRGFVYKGELIVAIEGLRDMIVVKPKVTVGDLVKSKKVEERKVLAVDFIKVDTVVVKEEPVVEETKEEIKVEEVKKEEEEKPVPKKRGPKPKKR